MIDYIRCSRCGVHADEELVWDNGCVYCDIEDDCELNPIIVSISKTRNKMDNEVYYGLVGKIIGPWWFARSLGDNAEGTPGSVAFNWKLIDDRESSHGDVIGFYHTHPSFPATPSSVDYVTMKTWLISFGRPLLCLIEGTDGLKANWFKDDETPHVLGKVKKFGKWYVGDVPRFK